MPLPLVRQIDIHRPAQFVSIPENMGYGLSARIVRDKRSDIVAAAPTAVVRATRAPMTMARMVRRLDDDAVALVVVAVDHQGEEEGQEEEDAVPVCKQSVNQSVNHSFNQSALANPSFQPKHTEIDKKKLT